jgi:hypothetical protein
MSISNMLNSCFSQLCKKLDSWCIWELTSNMVIIIIFENAQKDTYWCVLTSWVVFEHYYYWVLFISIIYNEVFFGLNFHIEKTQTQTWKITISYWIGFWMLWNFKKTLPQGFTFECYKTFKVIPPSFILNWVLHVGNLMMMLDYDGFFSLNDLMTED